MGRKFVNTGPLAGQVGLPEGKRWRCPACTLLVKFEKLRCPRCTESVTEEERDEYYVNPKSVSKQHVPFHLSRPSNSGKENKNTTSSTADSSNIVIKEGKKPTVRKSTGNNLKSRSTNHIKSSSSNNNNNNNNNKKKGAVVRGFNAKKSTCNKNIKSSKKYKNEKSRSTTT